MGIAGTEGVFRRCAEETLRVLRSSADVIKTVLEVFNHDPLHSWYANNAHPITVFPAHVGVGLRLQESCVVRKTYVVLRVLMTCSEGGNRSWQALNAR
jgi:phosphatidylinositol kinase/protein kinase (PI-3  family)